MPYSLKWNTNLCRLVRRGLLIVEEDDVQPVKNNSREIPVIPWIFSLYIFWQPIKAEVSRLTILSY